MNEIKNGYMFRPAIWEPVGLMLGLGGPSGSGKTYSGMRIASGIVGSGNRFAVIDTENKRSRYYVKYFSFDVVDLVPPYRPDNYFGAIEAAIKRGYKAIIVDSMSHEHAGEGGVLEWQAEELNTLVERAKKREPNTPDWELEKRLGPKSWIEPKMSRKKTIQKLLFASTSIPIIVCFRAEEKLFIKKIKKDGREETIFVTEWAPVCGKEYPYEMTAFLMLSYDKPGYPQALKLQEQHKHLFPPDKQITEDCGKRIAEWAKGGDKEKILPVEESDIPSPEEEQEALKERGMIQSENVELIPFEKYKQDMNRAITREEVGKVFKEFVKGSHSKEILDQAAQLANDRQVELKKK